MGGEGGGTWVGLLTAPTADLLFNYFKFFWAPTRMLMQSLIFQTPSPDKKGDGGCTRLVLIKRAAHSPLPERSTISVCLARPQLAPSQRSSFPSERDLGEQNTLRNYCTITFPFAERVEKERGEARHSAPPCSPPYRKKTASRRETYLYILQTKKGDGMWRLVTCDFPVKSGRLTVSGKKAGAFKMQGGTHH